MSPSRASPNCDILALWLKVDISELGSVTVEASSAENISLRIVHINLVYLGAQFSQFTIPIGFHAAEVHINEEGSLTLDVASMI